MLTRHQNHIIKQILFSEFFNDSLYCLDGQALNKYISKHTHADGIHALAVVSAVIDGLGDLNAEVYRETHNTIPADTRDYRSISGKIRRSCRYYEKLTDAIAEYRPTTVDIHALLPYGYCDSANGRYHAFGKADLKRSVAEIKRHAPVLQLALF